jgi:hypothetical protein
VSLLDFLAQPSTSDIRGALRSIPVRKGGILPLTEYGDGSARLDWTAGVPGSIMDAFTAPARAYRGEIAPENMIPEGLNFAGSVALGSAAVPRPANAAGMLGGRLAKTADHDALARAEELAAKGTPRETIWNDTGWFQGPDKKWRFEIDDSGQRLKRPLEDLDKVGRPMPSDLVFQHDKLHEAYPQVGDIPCIAHQRWKQAVDRMIPCAVFASAAGMVSLLERVAPAG